MNSLPIDVVQLIGLETQSTQSYLNLSLCCRRFLKLLQKPRRKKVLRYFTCIKTHNHHNVKEWYVNGKLHREDGPAVEWEDGSKSWYVNGNWKKTFKYIQSR